MESTDVDRIVNAGGKLKVCKPYVAPCFQRLSPVAAKILLSRHADANHPDPQQMLEGVDHLHGEKGS